MSCRRFLVARDGSVYRLTNAKLDRLLRDPDGPVLPTFAGQQVRTHGRPGCRTHGSRSGACGPQHVCCSAIRRRWPHGFGSLSQAAMVPRRVRARSRFRRAGQARQRSRRRSSVRRARRSVEALECTGSGHRGCCAWANRLSLRVVEQAHRIGSGRNSSSDCTWLDGVERPSTSRWPAFMAIPGRCRWLERGRRAITAARCCQMLFVRQLS